MSGKSPKSQGNPRGLAWVRQQLQSAIELECSTLPIYLSAMFSLEVQSNTAYTAIRSVAMEEMVHMAIAANTLAIIGGSPRIANLQFAFPVQGLSGGVEPDIHVGLAKLSKPQLRNFMRIEIPAFLVDQLDRDEAYPTIGKFYGDIRQAILDNADSVREAVKAGGPANQVDDDIGFHPIQTGSGTDPITQAVAGLDEIMEQGEGSGSRSMFTGSGSEDEASHYNRFAELYYEHNYADPVPTLEMTMDNQAKFYSGRTIPFPEVVNTLAVPSDGYAKILALDPDAAAVTADLAAFDEAFSSILSALDVVWNGPHAASWKTLGGAVHSMVDLRVLSCFNLLRHQIPANAVGQLKTLYPAESARLAEFSDLSAPLFYGPRFFNTNSSGKTSNI
jgi:hypothetical protein